MAIAADKLRKLIQEQVDKNIERLEFEVDCIVKDLRRGKPSGFNVKKVTKAIADAKLIAAQIEKNIETIKKIRKALEKAQKAAEATEKAVTLSAALNAGAAAVAYAQKFIIENLKLEVKDLKSVTLVTPAIITTYKTFLSESAARIAGAIAERELKDSVSQDRTNMLS
jgi:ribosomal protein S3